MTPRVKDKTAFALKRPFPSILKKDGIAFIFNLNFAVVTSPKYCANFDSKPQMNRSQIFRGN